MPMRPPVHRPFPSAKPRQAAADFDARRGSSWQRGYNTEWRKLRRMHLASEPLCRFCFEKGLLVAADTVDHIIRIAVRPDLRLDDTNLRSLCGPCHSEMTAREDAEGRRDG